MVEGEDASAPAAPATSCGFVALIGAPNAGKSTLLNALVGAKISIVTPKVQTTRALIRGIAIEGTAQLIFVDTPGIFAPRRRLDRAMVGSAWGSAKEADLVALLIDASKGVQEDDETILRGLADVRAPKVLVLNKVDLVGKPKLLALTQALNERAVFAATYMISARSGDGVADLKTFLAAHVPPGPWLYPEDQISDAPLRHLAAEITREKLYLRLHQELPYQSTVETEAWTELKDGAVRIEQTIYVERESQRKIVLGKGGQTIKAIGAAARIDIAAAIEHPVHLFLFVKVREGWGDDPERYREMGLGVFAVGAALSPAPARRVRTDQIAAVGAALVAALCRRGHPRGVPLRAHPLRIFLVQFPSQRIFIDVAADTGQLGLIANDVFVVVALPDAAIERSAIDIPSRPERIQQ